MNQVEEKGRQYRLFYDWLIKNCVFVRNGLWKHNDQVKSTETIFRHWQKVLCFLVLIVVTTNVSSQTWYTSFVPCKVRKGEVFETANLEIAYTAYNNNFYVIPLTLLKENTESYRVNLLGYSFDNQEGRLILHLRVYMSGYYHVESFIAFFADQMSIIKGSVGISYSSEDLEDRGIIPYKR